MALTNSVTLVGNLGADPELRKAGNTNVLSLRLATKERIKKGEQWEEHTEWHRVQVWGARGEALAKILEKGTGLVVSGVLRTRSWDKDGEKRYATEVNADDVLVTSGRRQEAVSPAPAPSPTPRPQTRPRPQAPVQPNLDDDVPFD